MNTTEQAIKDKLESIFPSPEIASKVVNLIVHNRPAGWSRRSNAPYYKEVYAKQLKAEVDKMLENKKPLCFRYSTWCNTNTGMSHQTLYNRINQSIRYLIEQMDIDNKYRNWSDMVRVERMPGVGIIISFIPGLLEDESFRADEIEPRDTMPIWKREMEDWLESDSIKPFCKEGLALTPQEVIDITTSLGTLTNVQASVTSKAIKIIRTA